MDKSILDEIKEAIKNVFSIIGKTLKKYKKYLILTVLIIIAAIVVIKVLEVVKDKQGKVYLSDKIKKDLGCEKTGSCMYTSNTSQQNYVWYSGFMWRIVKINDDGSIKLILNEPVATVNYYNGMNNEYIESFIRLWLNEGVFLNGLNNPEQFISNYSFCYGNEAVECNDTVKDKVGLLTYSEYQAAGGKSSYINIGTPFWLATRKKDSDKEAFIVDKSGELQSVDTGKYYQVRPVINLKSTTMIVTTTKGTEENPYVLKGDEELKLNAYLKNRYPGEYIKFAGKVWRIAEKNTKYTKLILYGKDTKMAYGESNQYSDNKNTIKRYLNNVYYNILKGALPNIDYYLDTNSFYGGKLANGDAYTNIKIEDDKNRHTSARIGILSLGELFSGNDLNLDDTNMTWTMTPNGNTGVEGEVWLSDGTSAKYDKEYAVRPVVYIRDDVIVLAGTGNGRTRETAYEISVRR